LLGGNVGVGLEDAVYIKSGMLASSNASMVVKAKRIMENLGGGVASTQEVRKLLGVRVLNGDCGFCTPALGSANY
jgi:uncharacterized protein (DUF849 family)